jgi:hypothetical protein
MAIVKLAHGVPLPDASLRRRNLKYPWAEMNVGDSFLMENATTRIARVQVSAANHRYAPRRFTARAEGQKLRVWRLY